MEIEQGLFRSECRIGEAKPLYQHWIRGSATIWVDAGIASTPLDQLLPYVEKQDPVALEGGRQMLLITHADVDHFGGAAALAGRIPSLLVAAHAADVRWIESREAILKERYGMHVAAGVELAEARRTQLFERAGEGARPSIWLRGGERLSLGIGGSWQLIHCPGHSPGHIILWDEERAIALVADAALGRGLVDIHGRLAAPPPYYDVAAYLATLDRIAGLRPRLLLASHFPVYRGGDVEAFLADGREMVHRIGASLGRALDRHPSSTLAELCLEVAEEIALWPQEAALALADPLSAHLAYSRGRRAEVA